MSVEGDVDSCRSFEIHGKVEAGVVTTVTWWCTGSTGRWLEKIEEDNSNDFD
jgi:hypothetical protein